MKSFWFYLGTSNSTNDRRFLVFVIQTFTGKKSRTALRELNDDWRLDVASSFKSSIYSTI
jgi:hypothetical protein